MSTPPNYSKIVPTERVRKIWDLFGHSYPKLCISSFHLTTLDSIFLPSSSSDGGESDKFTPIEVEASAYFEKLKAASDDEINEMHAALVRKEAEEKEARHPLNAPSAHANAGIYDYYGKAAYWTWEEGIALLLKRNPSNLNIEAIRRSQSAPNIAREFARLYELVKRANDMRHIRIHNSPREFLTWAKGCRLSIPTELVEAVKLYDSQFVDWKAAFDSKQAEADALAKEIARLKDTVSMGNLSAERALSVRERESLLKMILGMAMEQYGHDPTAARNETAKNIENDLSLHGLSLDQDTIRRYLSEAKDRLLSGKTG